MRWIVHVVMLVALTAGVFGLLPRLGGLTHDAAALRHARLAFVVAAIVAQATSLGSYALLYRRVLASLGARLGFHWRPGWYWHPSWSATSPRLDQRQEHC